MKTKIKSLLIALGFILIPILKVWSQAGCFSGNVAGPLHTEVQSANALLDFTLEPGTPCSTFAGGDLTGVGINQSNAQFMLDILCDPTNSTNKDVNIGCLKCTPVNSVGYRIDSNYVIWTDGDITSLYSGVGAGFGYTNNVTSTNFHNTFVGYDADAAFGASGTGATENTAMGYLALTANVGSSTTYGSKNVAVGAYALESMVSNLAVTGLGNGNTAVGWGALQDFKPRKSTDVFPNTATGARALMNTDTGMRNTAVGYGTSEANTIGNDNVAVGHVALTACVTGGASVAVGSYCLTNATVGTNTGVGFEALEFTGVGTNNVAVGYEAMLDNLGGISNSGTGNEVMFHNTAGNMNVANGSSASFSNQTGDSNVAEGNAALYNNTVSCNTGTGNRALYNFTTGKYNTADGYLSSFGTTAATGDSNASDGALSMYNIKNGNANSAVGYRAGYSITSDTDCLFLGARTDRAAVPLRNAAAIGYHAITTKTNQMEVGNNNNNITMGLSNVVPSANYTRLELNTANGAGQFNVTATSTPPSYVNHQQGKGWSGLRFDDLTAISTPGKNPSKGYLSVDSSGNVILVDTGTGSSGSTTGIGYCGTLNPLASDGGYDLGTNLANFYFGGNSPSNPAKTDVIIGNTCGTTPRAKLDVTQYSSMVGPGSIGVYVENKDSGGCIVGRNPVIGLKSIVDAPATVNSYNKIAGWFESTPVPNCCGVTDQYAIFVPLNGGNISVGYDPTVIPFPCASQYLVDVLGTVAALHFHRLSDSSIKNTFNPIANALSVIKQIKGYSYYLNSDYQVDSSSKGIQYGFIAQQIKRVLPNIVTSSKGVCSMDYEEILPWAVEAIKQEAQTNDSLRNTLDSLRNAFKNVQNCLNQLCNNEHGQVHHHGNGSSDDSNTTVTNTQEVTLSAVSGVPLLYQNAPNPFSTGTKINYYLPEGTQGATMAFYDSYGNQMKVIQFSQTGNGTLNITPDNLTSGIYSYSLIVNGKIVDTKRMLLQK